VVSAIARLRLRIRNRLRGVRRDVVCHQIQPDLELRVYWKALAIGRGPAVALYVAGHEAIRFDCFGERGHYHVFLARDRGRRYFTEAAIDAQIERAARELLHHLRAHLGQSADPRVREFPVDPRAMERAVAWMRSTMTEYARMARPGTAGAAGEVRAASVPPPR
jgi:hypothetical protein